MSQKAQETVELYRSKIAEMESAAFTAKIEGQHKDDEIAKLKKRVVGVEEEKALNARTIAELQQQVTALSDIATEHSSKPAALPFAIEAELNQLYVRRARPVCCLVIDVLLPLGGRTTSG